MSTFTSTITESVTLNGSVRGSTNVVNISDVDLVSEQILYCPGGTKSGAATLIGNWASVTNAAKYQSFDFDHSKYIRVTNLDEVSYIKVAFVSNGQDDQCRAGDAADNCSFKLEPGQSAIMWDAKAGKLGEKSEPTFGVFTDLSYISIWNPTSGEEIRNINVEMFVAGVRA